MIIESIFKIILVVAFILLIISHIIRVKLYKRNLEKIYLHSNTYRHVVNTMVECKRLKAEKKLDQYPNIAEYIEKWSTFYAEHYIGNSPKYKDYSTMYMEKDTPLFKGLIVEDIKLRYKTGDDYTKEDKEEAKNIMKLFLEFIDCLDDEYKYCNSFNIKLKKIKKKIIDTFKGTLQTNEESLPEKLKNAKTFTPAII